MPASPLTCSQCGGPHEKVDHHCPWCRSGLVPDDEEEEWIKTACDEMDAEDALFESERLYSFGWTDPKTIYGAVSLDIETDGWEGFENFSRKWRADHPLPDWMFAEKPKPKPIGFWNRLFNP